MSSSKIPPRSVGSEDDWPDFEAFTRRKAANKPVLNRAKVLPPEEGNGTVTELFPNQSAVLLDGKAAPSLCGYRMSTLAFGSAVRERSPVCVGDRVLVEAGVITGRCERRNRLLRPAPDASDLTLHVLASNLDALVVVASACEPGFNGGIVDRFLVAASAQKIPAILCVNKADLLAPGEERPWAHYVRAGVALVEASARDGRGTGDLAALVRGKVSAFCGNSGVGKTSLLRRLLNDEDYGRTTAVNERSGMGRHTTSGAVMLAGPESSSFVDTPGVMNFGLYDVAADGLLPHFPELQAAAASCPAGCAHEDESGCRLRALPRHESFRAIRRSLARGRTGENLP
ncbi:MAG: ribosome small subunit-dependent GTPase A [Elusimicrobiota bacterium]|jgi:ribosome biogenesis GTPase